MRSKKRNLQGSLLSGIYKQRLSTALVDLCTWLCTLAIGTTVMNSAVFDALLVNYIHHLHDNDETLSRATHTVLAVQHMGNWKG